MRRFMKNYVAHFANSKTGTMIAIDGISETHATARAWIKFMKTRLYKEDADGWELEELELAK